MVRQKFMTKEELLNLPNCDLSKVLKKVANNTILRVFYSEYRSFTDIVTIYDTDEKRIILDTDESVSTTTKF